MLTSDDIIIENEKDKRILDYLLKIRGKSGIDFILKTYFSGETKPYISNILKYAKIEVPDYVLNGSNILKSEEAQEHLKALKASLKVVNR